jgi:hypothetical protein
LKLPINFLLGLVSGGLGIKIIDYLIAWKKERREQQAAKTEHEKDRPRFRVDVTKTETSHAAVPAFIVEIFSLGGLPLTIDDGKVFITSDDQPERVQTEKLGGRVISPSAPIKLKFPLAHKYTNPLSGRKPAIEMVCQFSYGADEPYKKKWVYNHRIAQFDEVNHGEGNSNVK